MYITVGYSSLLATLLYVCLSVCLLPRLAKASLSSTPRKRYVQHWYRLFSAIGSWIFEKKLPFKSYGVKKPIC